MRLIAIAAALVVATVTTSEAQTCYVYGGVMTCGNGTPGYRFGNAAIGPTPTIKRNDTLMYSDSGAPYSGNSTIFSNGRSAYTYDSTTVTIDGRTCYRNGSALICNRPYQGLAPSFSYSPALGSPLAAMS